MSSRKTIIIIGVIIAVFIPIFIISSYNSALKKSIKIKEDKETSNLDGLTSYVVVEKNENFLLVSEVVLKDGHSEDGSQVAEKFEGRGLFTLYYKDVKTLNQKGDSLKDHSFETTQVLKIKYELVQERYPANFVNVDRVIVMDEKASEGLYASCRKIYDDYIESYPAS